MNYKLLIIGSKNFNNSINEVKECLNFSLSFYDFMTKSYLIDSSISAIIVDSQVLDIDILGTINKVHNNEWTQHGQRNRWPAVKDLGWVDV